MAAIRTQVTLDRKGGKSEDVITNTWHWEDDSEGGVPGDDWEFNLDGLVNRIKTFYAWCGANLFSNLVTGTGVIKTYKMTDLPDLYPRREDPLTFAAPTQGGLPAEVAVALSYNAARVEGVAQGRLRGRVWLGPVNVAVTSMAAGENDVRFSDTKITGLLTAAETMATGGTGAYRLSVFSPTILAGGGTLDAAYNDVVRLTCDNAMDVIRSRGADATKRYEAVIGGDATTPLVS